VFFIRESFYSPPGTPTRELIFAGMPKLGVPLLFKGVQKKVQIKGPGIAGPENFLM
jgi:hypothetical protein